jgi:hypothetical protein
VNATRYPGSSAPTVRIERTSHAVRRGARPTMRPDRQRGDHPALRAGLRLATAAGLAGALVLIVAGSEPAAAPTYDRPLRAAHTAPDRSDCH